MSEARNGAGGLEGRVALVTGASSGLGRASAVALAEAGADVALVARSEEDLRGTEGEVSGFGGRALVLPTDLASVEETAGAVERTLEEFGRVDVLVNAAGTDAPGTVEELDVEGWDRTLDVNLRAPFLLSKAVFAPMREAGGGLILNVSSVAGKKGWANASAYCASKFGLAGLIRPWRTRAAHTASGPWCSIRAPWRPTGASGCRRIGVRGSGRRLRRPGCSPRKRSRRLSCGSRQHLRDSC